ncbi:MAG TPA: hypothetical protein VE621_10275 [Bryobacteraceae bacterium]|nr:hypothetical protein [Bryobacteraceae bacterium]
MQPELPFDFGEYSHRTLGITVNLPLALGERLKEILPLLVTGVAEDHLSGFRSLFREAANEDEAFLALGYASALKHELRHFHDYLLSPAGAADGAVHMMAAVNMNLAMVALSQQEEIVLPLQTWERLQERWYKILQRNGKGSLSPKPPERTRPYTEAATIAFEALRQREIASVELHDGRLTTARILECSALAVQATYLILNYGAEAWPAFRDGLFRADRSSVYTTVWRLWDQAFQWLPQGVQLSYFVLNSILFMSLCGLPDMARSMGFRDDPPYRLVDILEYLARRQEVPTDDNILPLLDSWAANNGLLSMIDSVDLAIRSDSEYVDNTVSEIRAIESNVGAPIFGDMPEVLKQWTGARAHMAQQFIEDPRCYLDPVLYLKNPERFVASPMFLATTSGVLDRDGELAVMLRGEGWKPIFGRRSEDGSKAAHWLMRAPRMTAGHEFLTQKQSWDLSSAIWLSHLLWAPDMLGPVEREVALTAARSLLPNTTVLVL